MNKTFKKALSVLLAVMMFFTAAPAIVMAAEGTPEAPAVPVFAIELVSDSDEATVISLELKENSFKCLGLTITACENLVLEKIEFNVDIFMTGGIASANAENGMISIARTTAFEAEYTVATYTFTKVTADSICADDFEIEVTDCGIEVNGEDIDVTETVVVENNIPDTHVHSSTTEDRKEPTCTEDGYVKNICDGCGEQVGETEVLPATNHANTTEDRKDASCEEEGYVKVICDDCGEQVGETEVLPATNHKNTTIDRKEPTCTEPGYVRSICTDCEKQVNEIILPVTNHEKTTEDRKEPTCTEDGYVKNICDACGEQVGETVVLPATNHEKTTEDRKEPTCTEDGYVKNICDACGEQVGETVVLPATNHEKTTEDRKEPTCTEDGYVKNICDACGEQVGETVVLPATGHEKTTEDRKEPTCTEDGYVKNICDACGEQVGETVVLTATGHEKTTEDRKEPTCTVDGYVKNICDACGEQVGETVVLPAPGHGETETDRLAPTCTKDGYIRHICKVCNEIAEETILNSNGHNHIQDIKVSTCTEDGYIRQYCPACGDVKPGAVILYSTGHRWSSWTIVEKPTYSKEGVERRICNNCGVDEERSVAKLVTKPTELVMSMQQIGMNFKQTTRLFVNILPEEAAYSTEIIWESSDESVATVDETGAVYGVQPGTAIITARTADGSLEATCEVTVSYSILQLIIIYVLFGWIWYL